MKKIFTISIALLLGASVFGQLDEKEKDLRTKAKGNTDSTKIWTTGGMFNLNFGQTSLHNWSAGGLNSYNFNGLLSLFANHSKGKLAWDNSLELEYGSINQFSPGAADSAKKWLKNSDRIELNSKVGYEAGGHWYYTGLLNFRTQMAPGYDASQKNVISDITSPAYTTLAIGMDYKPSSNFNVFISPIAYRALIVSREDLRGRFGFTDEEVAAGPLRSEVGAYIKANYKKDEPFGIKNVSFKTDLAMFSNYLDHPENIDIYWNTLIGMKVNKYITANIGTNLIYDDNIMIQDINGGYGPRVQFKEALTVGFSYKF